MSNIRRNSLAGVSESTKRSMLAMYHKFNLFPEFVEKRTNKHAIHGCRQTTTFGLVCLVLLLSLTLYYALEKNATSEVISSPGLREINDLFRSGYQPYCECTNTIVQNSKILSVNFTRDSLCLEITNVWNAVQSKRTDNWDKDVFKLVIKGIYDLCKISLTIQQQTYTRFGKQYFKSPTLLKKQDLNQIFGVQRNTLKQDIAALLSTSFQLFRVMLDVASPASYSGDTQSVPTTYKDIWAYHRSVRLAPNNTLISLSQMSSIWRNTRTNYSRDCEGVSLYLNNDSTLSTARITRTDLQCYFSFWEGKECKKDYDKMVYLIRDGSLLGDTSFSYDFEVSYYCSAVETLTYFPTKALASREFWNWSTLADSSFGYAMNQSTYPTILNGIREAFIVDTTGDIVYNSYFDECSPDKCSYVKEEHASATAIIIVVFGLMGGFISLLRIIVPILYAPCAPNDNEHQQSLIVHSKKVSDDGENEVQECTRDCTQSKAPISEDEKEDSLELCELNVKPQDITNQIHDLYRVLGIQAKQINNQKREIAYLLSTVLEISSAKSPTAPQQARGTIVSVSENKNEDKVFSAEVITEETWRSSTKKQARHSHARKSTELLNETIAVVQAASKLGSTQQRRHTLEAPPPNPVKTRLSHNRRSTEILHQTLAKMRTVQKNNEENRVAQI
mmetsp:Transcript_31158/g.50196  ORF Transcript_31158/g.50196 Transcript_31158/m.50196 type:complete len:674 (+) Transcript_31158:211-2232(+)